jgi:hypothetical protein
VPANLISPFQVISGFAQGLSGLPDAHLPPMEVSNASETQYCNFKIIPADKPGLQDNHSLLPILSSALSRQTQPFSDE